MWSKDTDHTEGTSESVRTVELETFRVRLALRGVITRRVNTGYLRDLQDNLVLPDSELN